ncbi:hypothetical protein GQ457_06G043740 [Hibiscus cannabinus]
MLPPLNSRNGVFLNLDIYLYSGVPYGVMFLERHLPLFFNGEQPVLWAPLADQGWRPCLASVNAPSFPQKSEGYLQVFLDGGLNQQRMGICDAVAISKMLNATLVIPHLEVNPVWQDSSSFMDIFDVDLFINVLKNDISIIKELPEEFSWSTREYYGTAIRATRVKRAPVHASANWYLENVLPLLQSYGIAAISPFSHRMTFDDLVGEIQQLRCKVNFKALVFVPHTRALGDALVHRLRYPKGQSQAISTDYLRETTDPNDEQKPQKFVELHLRFDKDMAAHSACDFGGGKSEKLALAKYRQTIWQGRELWVSTIIPIFILHPTRYMEGKLELFPLMEDKKSLASSEERVRIKGKASLLAAVDYYVGMHSDIFISASPGNMHNALVGHRSFENMKTIRPNMGLVGPLLLNKNITWSEFRQAVVEGHQKRHGQLRLRKPKHTYPAPDCMCHA